MTILSRKTFVKITVSYINSSTPEVILSSCIGLRAKIFGTIVKCQISQNTIF